MGTTKLALYSGALRIIKERRLATVTDDVPSRYLLDDIYDRSIAYCLEQGQWMFASRSASIVGSASSNRGYAYRFAKPSDFVRLIAFSASSSYYPPLEQYAEDSTYWFANESTIYVTYVSNNASYGLDLTKWPKTFSKTVEAWMAQEIAPHLSKSDDIIKFAVGQFNGALDTAIAKDTINRTVRVLSAATEEIYKAVLRLVGKRLLTNFDDRTIRRRAMDASPGKDRPYDPQDDVDLEMILRRLLDESYDKHVGQLLEMGLWNFGSRTVAIEAETDIDPAFGYSYVFMRPDDYVRLVAIADNGTLYPTLEDYLEEGPYWHANVNPLYVQYVSDDVAYGYDSSLWPPSFIRTLEHALALEIAPYARVSAAKMADLRNEYRKHLRNAKGKDASNQAAMRPSPGRLTQARVGFRGFNGDQRREN